ncbi:MAG: glycosyltransferase family 2 protein [Isosphaeraceae bacterium]
MPEPRVSVLVVAKDEAHNLADCLTTARWADERVVVVDASSRDETLAIARRDADVLLVREFDDFASQRNAGIEAASGDWLLSVDADERVTPELAAEIRSVINDNDPATSYRGYRVPIRSEVLGRRFAFSGTQHDLPLRLFRRDSGRWVGLVHETVELSGPAGTLASPLNHRTIPTMKVFLEKINNYTTLEAEGLARSGRAYRATDLTLRPPWTFFKLYVLKQGFRDGVEGFIFCLFSGVSTAVRAWKHRELVLPPSKIEADCEVGVPPANLSDGWLGSSRLCRPRPQIRSGGALGGSPAEPASTPATPRPVPVNGTRKNAQTCRGHDFTDSDTVLLQLATPSNAALAGRAS